MRRIRSLAIAAALAALALGSGCTPFGYYSIAAGVLSEAISPTFTEGAEPVNEPEPGSDVGG